MKINEIFYSIQGEGLHAGTPAVFVRFSGCNLRCPFCDTEHQQGKKMEEDEIVDEVIKYPTNLVIFTGGEPTLQLTETLCALLHGCNKIIAIETNGTRPVPEGVDFITLSPKHEFTDHAELAIAECSELKVVYNGSNAMEVYDNIKAQHKFLQPCDTGETYANREIINKTIDYCLAHPEWRISLQTQKILNVR